MDVAGNKASIDKADEKAELWKQVDYRAFIPGAICLVAIIAAGAVAPDAFGGALTSVHGWLMANFKWLYILVVIVVVALFLFILLSKYGNIRLGGKDAKPSISKFSWFCLTMTSTIAVGICFYGVAGPVNMFMNPPEFMGVEAGSQEAIIPVLEYCFLHYSLPPYFIILTVALAIALVYYNGRRTLRASDALFPLVGERANGIGGTIVNTLQVICLLICGTNMGLAVIQLNAGIGTVSGMDDMPQLYIPIVINIAVALFMGALTLVLLYAGGYDALSECMVVVAFPIAIVLLLMCLSVFKFLFHREKYDATYREELEEERARKQEEFDKRVVAAARDLLDE